MRRVEKEAEKKIQEAMHLKFLDKVDFLSHEKAREYRARKINKINAFLAVASEYIRVKKTIND